MGLTPGGASPASSNASFHSVQQPYYAVQPPAHRASPQSTYSFDVSRGSSSPHSLGYPGTPAAAPTSSAYQPTMPSGMNAANAARQGVKINDIVGGHVSQQQQQQQAAQQAAAVQAAMKQEERERTSTDSTMVQALLRGPNLNGR